MKPTGILNSLAVLAQQSSQDSKSHIAAIITCAGEC